MPVAVARLTTLTSVTFFSARVMLGLSTSDTVTTKSAFCNARTERGRKENVCGESVEFSSVVISTSGPAISRASDAIKGMSTVMFSDELWACVGATDGTSRAEQIAITVNAFIMI